MLTHLLLLLQHKQLHKKSGNWDSNTLLLLQPLSCEHTSEAAPLQLAAGARLQDSAQLLSTAAAAASQPGSGTVVHSGAGAAHYLDCECPVDELRFFATFMPLQTLLSVEHSSSAATAAGCGAGALHAAAAGAEGTLDAAAAGSAYSSSAASLQSLSAADSSTEEQPTSSRTRPHSSSKHVRHSKGGGELLKAASSSSSGAAAFLLDAAERGRLHCVRVGPHTDAAATAASIASAVTGGRVLALHVKQASAAHAVVYPALELASRALHGLGSQQQQDLSFGVLLVQGQGHEHVHARAHGHGGRAGTSDAEAAAAAGAGAAAAGASDAAQQHHHQHLKAADASMDVGGIGAAFYGLGGWGDRSGGQQQQGVSHKHGQEVWMVVVCLGGVGF